MKLLCIGDNVCPGEYRLHSRFKRAINFLGEKGFVSVVTREVGAGPINVVVDVLNPNVDSLVVEGNVLIFGGYTHDATKCPRYNSRIDDVGTDAVALERNLGLFERVVLSEAPSKSLAFLLDDGRAKNFSSGFEKALLERVRIGADKLFGEDIVEGVKMLRGCGLGLTPSGDDLIAGILLGLNLKRRIYGERSDGLIARIYDAAIGGSVFSKALLALAKNGQFTGHFKRLVVCLLGDNAEEIAIASKRVLSLGETSGADTATGFILALKRGHRLCL